MARTRSPATDGRAGYVLIEALAALAITILLLSLSYPLVAGGTTPPRMLALVSASVSLLRDARTDAMASGRPVAARFDADHRRLVARSAAVSIPADVAFSLTAGGNCRTGEGGAAVLFRPDGSGCGAVLRFAKGAQVLRARVNWADGHVDIAQGANRRGFTLVEALVALVVAGLILPALSRALGGAWSASRAPMDVVSAIVLARDVAEGAPVPADARERGYAAERGGGPATLLILPSAVAPAPRGTGQGDDSSDLHPEATPAAIRLVAPKSTGGPPPGPAPTAVQLRRVSVAVRTPAGRRITLETVKLADAPH